MEPTGVELISDLVLQHIKWVQCGQVTRYIIGTDVEIANSRSKFITSKDYQAR